MSADPVQQALEALKNTQTGASQTTSHYLGVPASGYQTPTFGAQEDAFPGISTALTGTGQPYAQTSMGQARGPVLYQTGDELAPLSNPELIPQLQVQLV